ncbi:MAG: protein FdrA, partial [Candidatus Rokubacteria bacterium]|nr:protein FdrA [Candidatus Rokubacteria bacterium]
GVPLGFANAVPRGRVGIIAASGTGLQQVASLLAAGGEGISEAIGVGGRDMSDAVGGLMTLAALDALGADAATTLIAIVGKPPAPAVRRAVEERLREIGKPAVIGLLGGPPPASARPDADGLITTATTLEDVSGAVLERLGRGPRRASPFTAGADAIRERVGREGAAPRAAPRGVRGLFAGGTLAHEALGLLESLLGPVASNLRAPGPPTVHRVLDLGADEYTVGRAHPMLDATTRVEEIRRAGADPAVAVLLLDVILGRGASPDPAGELVPGIAAARAAARSRGSGLAVVASVVGTDGDPQGRSAQTAALEAAGAWVLPSNAQAARAAAAIAGGEAVLARLAGSAA